MLDCDLLPKGYSLRLILIRHGEPDPEARGRCHGRLDIGLSKAGREQIRAKFSLIRNVRAAALYSSPLKRAAESAAVAGACLRLRPILRPELQEICFGCLEGLTYGEIDKLYPEEFKLWMRSPTAIKFPGGESFADLKRRVLRFKESLFAPHDSQAVAVVGHGGPNRVILAEALGIPDSFIFRIDQAYGAVNIIDYFERLPVVRLLNG